MKLDDPSDKIADGIRAAMALSFHKLLRLGYSRRVARAELLRLTRDAINRLDEPFQPRQTSRW